MVEDGDEKAHKEYYTEIKKKKSNNNWVSLKCKDMCAVLVAQKEIGTTSGKAIHFFIP